jgi:phage terminase small subunit
MTNPISKEQTELEGMPEPLKRLTVKQQKFVTSYLTHFNGTRAAREAGYSKRTASGMAVQNLRNTNVLRYIKRHLDHYALSSEEVIAKLGAMARGEIPTRTVHRDDGAGVVRTETYFEERAALEDVAKVQGLFIDRHSIERIDGIEVVDDVAIPQLSDNGGS